MRPRYTSITDKRNIKGLLKTFVQKKNLVQSMHEALEYKKIYIYPYGKSRNKSTYRRLSEKTARGI